MSLSTQLLGYDVGEYVELYDILLGERSGNSADNLYYTPNIHWDENTGNYTGFIWKGNSYVQIPSKTSGFKMNLQGTQSQPTFTVSNIQHIRLVPLLEQYEEFIGVTFNRWRTFENFVTDVGEPYLSKETYIISQLTKLTNEEMTFKLISSTDRDDAKIPFRQVLRDKYEHAGKTYQFPGVARDGSRRR